MSGKDLPKPAEVSAIERRESLILPETYRTFLNLQDAYGPERKLVGREILERILDDPSIDKIVITGLPGVGKTINVRQLTSLLIRNGVAVENIFFDDLYQEFCTRIGKTPSQWDEDDHQQFSHEIKQKVENMGLGKNKKAVIETPFMLPDLTENALVIAIAADPRNQDISWFLRMYVNWIKTPLEENTTEIEWMSPTSRKRERIRLDRIQQTLESAPYNLRVSWLNLKPSTSIEGGKILLEALRKSAPPRAIVALNTRALNLVDQCLEARGLTEKDLLPLPPLPESSRPLLEDKDLIYQKFIYYERERIDELVKKHGLPKENGRVILNPHTDTKVFLVF